LALAYPAFRVSVPLSATCTFAGLFFSCVVLVWSLLTLFRHWQRALFGFLCLLVALLLLAVMADIFAVYQHRKQSPNQSRQPTPGARLTSISASLARRGCAVRWVKE
jgi:hypothetical protein